MEVGPSDVELLAAAGVDTTHLPDLTEGGRVEVVATSRQAKRLTDQGCPAVGEEGPRQGGLAGAAGAGRRRLDVVSPLRGARRHPGRAERDSRRGAVPEAHQGGDDRPHPQGRPILAIKLTKDARSLPRRQTPGGALRRRPARPRVDHPGDEPPADAPRARQLRHRPGRSPGCLTPPSSGSCRWPTRTATTTPSPRATGCGARTCATTTATGRSPAATAST